MTTGLPRLPGAGLVRIAFQLNALNFILPLRLGELSYPALMRHRYGASLLHSAGVLCWRGCSIWRRSRRFWRAPRPGCGSTSA